MARKIKTGTFALLVCLAVVMFWPLVWIMFEAIGFWIVPAGVILGAAGTAIWGAYDDQRQGRERLEWELAWLKQQRPQKRFQGH